MTKSKQALWVTGAIILILLLSVPCWAQYNPGLPLDANCVGLWNMETITASEADASQNSNTLLAGNATLDNSIYVQGAGSADFSSLLGMYRDDTDLSSDFPFKYGTTNKVISVCAWFRLDDFEKTQVIAAKWASDSTPPIRGWWLLAGASGNLAFQIDADGEAADPETASITHTLNTSIWFHVGMTYREDTKAWTLRLYDSNDTTVYSNSGTFADGGVWLSDVPFFVGSMSDARALTSLWYPIDGKIDEVAIFNDILTADEIDEIRQGTYGATAAGRQNWWWRRRHNN